MIYLKNSMTGSMHIFETEDGAEAFIEYHEFPDKIIKCPVVYVDGSGWNGEQSGYCYVVDNAYFYKFSDVNLTNNQAEYLALKSALEVCKHDSVILSDSQLVVNQIKGSWYTNLERLRLDRDYCRDIIKDKRCKLIWIPRRENKAGIYIDKLKLKN